MNLIKEYLGAVTGVEIFAIISMLIFISVFIFMIIHTYSLKKEEVREYSQLPLDDNEVDPTKDHTIINE